MAFGNLFGGFFGACASTISGIDQHPWTGIVKHTMLPGPAPQHTHTWPPSFPGEEQFDALMQEIAGAENDEQLIKNVRAFAKKYMAKKVADALRAQQAQMSNAQWMLDAGTPGIYTMQITGDQTAAENLTVSFNSDGTFSMK